MESIWTAIISATISGLLATLITIFVKRTNDIKKEKREIFKILMSYRYDITNQQNVNAMNRIQATFYSNDEVLRAWKEFNEETNKVIDVTKQNNTNSILDKYLKLLEKIAESCGYKKIRWDDIKVYYYPKGLAIKITEENALRSETLKRINSQDKQGVSSSDQMAITLITEALKHPDGMNQINKLVEIANKVKSK